MDLTKFKALLDDQVSWPDYYSFKFIVKTERNVSELLQNNYNISLSHMYIRRNLTNIEEYVLQDGILIKKLW